MNWDNAYWMTKFCVYFILRLVLVGGSVIAAITLGSVAFLIQSQTAGPVPWLFGLATGVATYLAGMAGVGVADRTLLRLLRRDTDDSAKDEKKS